MRIIAKFLKYKDGFEVCNECGVVPSTGKRTITSERPD